LDRHANDLHSPGARRAGLACWLPAPQPRGAPVAPAAEPRIWQDVHEAQAARGKETFTNAASAVGADLAA
jgi:hypothetical protein